MLGVISMTSLNRKIDKSKLFISGDDINTYFAFKASVTVGHPETTGFQHNPIFNTLCYGVNRIFTHAIALNIINRFKNQGNS